MVDSLFSGAAVSGAQQAITPGLEQAIQGAMVGGQIDYPRLQRIMGLTNQQMDSLTQSGAIQGVQSKLGTLSTYPSQPAAPGTAPAANTGTPIAGKGEAWLSPDELRAKTNALQSGLSSGGSYGGGTGGSISRAAAGSTGGRGGLLTGLDAAAAANSSNNTSPSFNSLQPINSQPISYQSPGGGGMAPGGQTGYTPPITQGSGAQGGTLDMQQPNPQNALQQYMNTPGQQLLGSGAGQHFQQSPGYQYAMDEAMRQVQNQASARGMLESGAVLKNMQQTASGLAQQDYGNWWNRQNQLYGDYQNRLAGLAGGDVGANNAMALGQSMGVNAQNTGNNLGSLFGNQGTSGLGAYANTGAAQANNMNQAANTQLQTNSANTSTLLAGAMLNRGSF